MIKLTDAQVLECLDNKENNNINKCIKYLLDKYGVSCCERRLKALVKFGNIDISYFSGKVKYKKEELLPKVLLHYKESRNREDLLRKCGFESKTQAGRLVKKIIKDLSLDVSHWSRKFSKETREKISSKRKEFLKNNPDKHPWKRSSKFKSAPCEKLKEFLREKNIVFAEEFTPLLGEKNYSLDIAFPDKKVGIEVNGNQHYERDGKLKPYYQERHDLIESFGWKLYEVHYSSCFNREAIVPILESILNSPVKIEFDYLTYVPKSKVEYKCKKCGKNICSETKSGFCRKCSEKEKPKCFTCNKELSVGNKGGKCREHWIESTPTETLISKSLTLKKCAHCNSETSNLKYCNYYCAKMAARKVNHPSKEELEKLVWRKPTSQIANELGVSDNAVGKWCERLGIEKPPRGYWRKLQTGNLFLDNLQNSVNL